VSTTAVASFERKIDQREKAFARSFGGGDGERGQPIEHAFLPC
jgi:hypothetical protein